MTEHTFLAFMLSQSVYIHDTSLIDHLAQIVSRTEGFHHFYNTDSSPYVYHIYQVWANITMLLQI